MNAQITAKLQEAGYETWTTPSNKIRTTARLNEAKKVLAGMNVTVTWNTAYSKSADGSFVTLVSA